MDIALLLYNVTMVTKKKNYGPIFFLISIESLNFDIIRKKHGNLQFILS